MALAENEKMIAGFIRDVDANFALVMTEDDTNATMTAGFLRDPDGRLVVVVI
jgi:hypothetical protein